ncbi:polysaccharide pyruvyl transferase family protein [Pseudomonas sp. SWRI102]|uniref:Polysaccharide pyruvyl transferase family protein n=1 Tax=Pseudomonas marvdashtae TaxID=2745500 RepID=A0A923FJQ4_9PSED|nr:polysaccharide pyruvyl transferase family protein [Pseudomonas marvdashtae]
MSFEVAISAKSLGKCYQIYDAPKDRLLQMLVRGRKRFYREFWALDDVSLTIARGETVGIIGRNGSGKSTLLQLICGTLMPTRGSVQSHGRIAALLELGSGFNPEFTGRENVYVNAAVLGLSRAEIDARFDDILAFANIGDFIDQPTKIYSSGMLVRLAFAVSVCVEPEILIVDEALSVGDASFQFKCLNRLEALAANGTTLLFVSHDMSMVKRFCHRVIYLRAGRVVASGSPDEMAELHLLDMRDEQRRWASGGVIPVTRKSFMGGQEGIAFGTEEGHISAACFTSTQQLCSSYLYGDNIEIYVEAVLHESIMQPNISFTIQEARLLVIGGGNFALQPGPVENGWRRTAITVRFPANLAQGRYHVTLKLLHGATEDTSQLIEKQVAPLAFDMLPNPRNFLGMVDLGLQRIDLPPVESLPKPCGTQGTRLLTQQRDERTWQVAIFGTFDVENYGDLLFPIIAEAELTRRLGPVNLHRFSYHGKTRPEWPYAVTSLTELPHIAPSLDGVLIGGGFLIRFDKVVAHGYGPTTDEIHHPTGYWLTPALIALQHAIPLMWNAPGMHCNAIPDWARPLLKMALEQSQYVRVRDALSRDALGALAGQAEIEVLPDTAFGLPCLIDEQQPSAEFIRLRQHAGLSGPYIVIHAIHVVEPFVRLFEDHAEAFQGYQFLVVPIGPVLGDDPSVIAARLPGAVTLSFWPEPLLMAQIISQAQAVIGHSYHLAITALAFGVPVFCSADLTTGKYTALAGFDTLHALPDVATVDPQWFRARVGKTHPSPAARAAADRLVEHWDRVAAIIRRGKTASQPVLGAFLQHLPNLLEAAAEGLEPSPAECPASPVVPKPDVIEPAQNLAQQQRIVQLREQLARSDARMLELQNSHSFRMTAPLRSIARGIRNLTAIKN